MKIDKPHSLIDLPDFRALSKQKRHIKNSIYLRDRVFIEVTKTYEVFCGICKKLLGYKYATIDHIVPLSKGGTSFISNLQLTHEKCNWDKDAIASPKLNRRIA